MLSLFSGIGGMDLSAEWTGQIETIAFCEKEPYCQGVLKKHWTNVQIYGDICELRGDKLGTVDIILGGFPCQDLSIAGKRAGLIDEQGETTRSGLWYEMLRVIRESKPEWVVGENVAGLLSHDDGRTFNEIITGLEDTEYEVLPVVSPASNYGAAFEGKRVFVIAASKSSRHGGRSCEKLRAVARKLVKNEFKGYTLWGKTERRIIQAIRHQETISDDLRSDYGISDWVDRLKCLGNTVVPYHIYPIFQAIVDIESKLERR